MLGRLLMGGACLALIAGGTGCGGDDSRPDPGTDGGTTPDGGDTACPAGQSYFVPGCGSGEDVTITAGCYQPCTDADDGSCPVGMSCQRTDINPCICPAGEGCCAACGAEQWVCLEDGAGTDPYELGALDESCEGILTGQDVLDAIEDGYTAPFEYHDERPSTDLSLTFAYEDGRLVCHPAIPAPPGSRAPDQPTYLEVEVTAGISTADGAFDESTETLLSSYAPGSAAQLAARLDAEALGGTYEPQLADVSEHTVTFGGQLMGASTSGNAVEGGMRSSGMGETTGIGSWDTGG